MPLSRDLHNDICVVLSSRDMMSLGITLVGHQKKIMSSIQTMRAQMLHIHGTGVQVWQTPWCSCRTSPANRNKAYLEQCLGCTPDHCQSTWTLFMSDSSNCVWSKIIPLFLTEGLWFPLQRALKRENDNRKRKKQQQKTTWMWWLFTFFSCVFIRSTYTLTTYQIVHRKSLMLSLSSWMVWVHTMAVDFLGTNSNLLLAMGLLVPFSEFCLHLPQWTVGILTGILSFIWTRQQGAFSFFFIQMKKEL